MKPEKKPTSYADAAPENHQVKPESLKTFEPSYEVRWNKLTKRSLFLKTMISDYFFVKRCISQPKTQ